MPLRESRNRLKTSNGGHYRTSVSYQREEGPEEESAKVGWTGIPHRAPRTRIFAHEAGNEDCSRVSADPSGVDRLEEP